MLEAFRVQTMINNSLIGAVDGGAISSERIIDSAIRARYEALYAKYKDEKKAGKIPVEELIEKFKADIMADRQLYGTLMGLHVTDLVNNANSVAAYLDTGKTGAGTCATRA